MKFFPAPDVWFYVDKPSCMNSYQKYPKSHSWKIHDKTTERVMLYWRDSEGVKKPQITVEDLYFKDWPKTRIRPQACLGMLYATGQRFIKLTQAPPGGFKCAPLPVNLATAQIINVELKKKAKIEAQEAKKAKEAAKAAEKAAKAKAAKEAEKQKKKEQM